MKHQGKIAGGILVAAVAAAAFSLDGRAPPERKKLAGGSEACTYHAGPMDAEMIDKGGDAGHRILREILMLDRKCEYVTLALPDGTKQVMTLGPKGRKPGDKPPASITTF